MTFTNHICQEDQASDSFSPLWDHYSQAHLLGTYATPNPTHSNLSNAVTGVLLTLHQSTSEIPAIKWIYCLSVKLFEIVAHELYTIRQHAIHMQLLLHENPLCTSPTDASIPAALNWLRPNAPICRRTLVKKKKEATADMNNMKSTTAWKGSRPVNIRHKATRLRSNWKRNRTKALKALVQNLFALLSDHHFQLQCLWV